MKTLVAFYSRTGNTKKVAEKIAAKLNANVEEIIDKKKRSGIFGWFGAAWDAAKKRFTVIETKFNPEEYDLVIIGTPVWASDISPAVRTYINNYKLKNIALFCTYGCSVGKTFESIEELEIKPLATLGLKTKNIDRSSENIDEFCNKVKI
jgi:flavodoxin